MSHSQASAGGPATSHETYRPTDGNFLDFQAAVMTALRAVTTDGLGRLAWKSLGHSIVTGPRYASMDDSSQASHDNCDALILKMVRAHLHPSDRWRIAKFAVNRKVNIPAPDEADEGDEGDGDVSMVDPTAPPWWCSPGRAAFDFLEAKFAGAKDHLSKARTAVYKVSLADYRGRLPEFEAAFEALRNTYEKAVIDRGAEDPATADNLLASHLADMFDQFDHDLYGDSCKDARRRPEALSCEDFMSWVRSDYDAKVKRQPSAPLAGVGDKVLVSEVGPPAWFLPYAHAFAAKTRNQTKALSTTAPPAAASKWAGPDDPADRALFERCKQHGCCYNFLKDKCRRQKCRWTHTPPPADGKGAVSTQVTLLATDAGPRHPPPLIVPSDVDSMRDVTSAFAPSVCPLSGPGDLSGVFNDTGTAVDPHTVLGIYDGVLIFGEEEFSQLYPSPCDAHYVMAIDHDVWVDASSPEFANWTREILHVAEPPLASGPDVPAPNCAFVLQDGVVYVVAIRHIPCHGQLSADYGPSFFFPPQDPALSPLPDRAPFPHVCGDTTHGEVAAAPLPPLRCEDPAPGPALATHAATATASSPTRAELGDTVGARVGSTVVSCSATPHPQGYAHVAPLGEANLLGGAVPQPVGCAADRENKRELEDGEDDGGADADSTPPTSSSLPVRGAAPTVTAHDGAHEPLPRHHEGKHHDGEDDGDGNQRSLSHPAPVRGDARRPLRRALHDAGWIRVGRNAKRRRTEATPPDDGYKALVTCANAFAPLTLSLADLAEMAQWPAHQFFGVALKWAQLKALDRLVRAKGSHPSAVQGPQEQVDAMADYVLSSVPYDPWGGRSRTLFDGVAVATTVARLESRWLLRSLRRPAAAGHACHHHVHLAAPTVALVSSPAGASQSRATDPPLAADGLHPFVIDTGANGIVFGGTVVSAGHLTDFAPTPGRVILSNDHKDNVLGTATLRGSIETLDGGDVGLSLTGLVTPASRWNILPPHMIPGFEGATVAPGGALTITAAGRTSRTLPYQGLQVVFLRLDQAGGIVLPTTAPRVSRPPSTAAPALIVQPPASPTLLRLHHTLAHAGAQTIHRLVRSGRIHVPDATTRTALLATTRIDCRHCALASNPARRAAAPDRHEPSRGDAGTWSADLCGPFERSAGGNAYGIVLVSHRSGMLFFGAIPAKSDAISWLAANFDRCESEAHDPIRVLRTDNGGEFVNAAGEELLARLGITHQTTAPHSSAIQNSRAERAIRTLRKGGGASLSRSGLGPHFWAESMHHAAYVYKLMPRPDGRPSPAEEATGDPPSLRLIHPFGSRVLVKDHAARKSMLAQASRPAVLLCPAPGTKDAFKVLYTDTQAVGHSRDLIHFDDEFPHNKDDVPVQLPLTPADLVAPVPTPSSEDRLPPHVLAGNPFAVLAGGDDTHGSDPARSRFPPRVRAQPAPIYSPGAYEAQREADRAAAVVAAAVDEPSIALATGVQEEEEPASLAAAMATPHSAAWLDAVRAELASHGKNGTWSVVHAPPKGRSAIPSRWIFKVKRGPDGEVTKYKARLVAKGFRQRQFVDYTDTFSPTLRTSTFRMLCALSCQFGLDLHQMDVETAFLVPVLKEEIYMRLPEQSLVNEHLPAFASQDTVRLHKTLYGLVQSPREFFLHFSSVLREIGFTQSSHDPCLWIKARDRTLVAAIAIWVDDAAIAASAQDITEIKEALRANFSMTDGGSISWFLGVQLHKTSNSLTLSQSTTINRIATECGCENSSPVSTPITDILPKLEGEPSDEDRLYMTGKKYRSLVGQLLYLLFTRPDVAYAVSQLARHVNAPRKIHWLAAIRLVKYLHSTSSLVLRYTQQEEPASVIGYSDADFAGDTATRRSTSGFVFMLCGGAISWRSKLQPSVSLSTCEAELVALSECAREAVWVKHLLQELLLPSAADPLQLREDNQATGLIVQDHRFSERTKHVDVRHFFVREQISEGVLTVAFCSTKNMIADIFTKPLGRIAFLRLRLLLGLHDPEQ